VRLSSGYRIGIGIDIRERKKSEEALRTYAEKLERSNRDLEDFAFVASHDLQEPLRKIRTFGTLVLEDHAGEVDEEGRDYLERMRSAAERMQHLIEALLRYSRVTTRGEPFEPVDLKEVVEEVVSDLEARVQETGALIETGDLPEIEADPSQMHQLLQNLISNALKFHGRGPPVVRISGEVEASPVNNGGPPAGSTCRIFVEDNGTGFDPRHAERIFGPFQRLHGRDRFEGTGMGLAICRKIAERHHGDIVVESEPGKGSTFIVKLPCKQNREEES
jgi:light-regulated signal transduction histidine kinase (bacteriophytochrome)